MELQKIVVVMELMCEGDSGPFENEGRLVIETVLEIINDGGDAEHVMNRTVDAAVTLHGESRLEGACCMSTSRHELLYLAGFVCCYLGIRRSDTIEKLLRCIHGCEGTFRRLYWGAILDREGVMGSNPLRLADYFLEVGNRLKFPVDGKMVRMVDVPLELGHTAADIAAVLGRPAPLALFLKHGSDPATVVENLSVAVAGSGALGNRVVPGLYVLARALPSLPPLLERLLPAEDRPPKPPLLRHVARCVIRRRLMELCQIPATIRGLPLPESLKSYLNLEHD